MRFIEEVIVDEFLPTVRCMLAEHLAAAGLTQREIAGVMGVSQSAVSNYLHGTVTQSALVREHAEVRALVDRLSQGLSSGEMSRVHALAEAERLVRDLETPGSLIADLYVDRNPGAADVVAQFNQSDHPAPVGERTRVVESVRRGLRILETTPDVVDLLPNVGTNLVEATHDASTPEDVVGVPGRLYDVRGRLIVPAEPAFGASHHVSCILLAARTHDHPARGAINLRYHPRLLDHFHALGHATVEFDDEQDPAGAIATALAGVPGADVFYQPGGFGIEPITYLLSADAEAAAVATRNLARRVRNDDPPADRTA